MKTKAALAFLAACISFLLAPGLALAQSAPMNGPAREVLSISWQSGYCAVRPKSGGCTDFSAASPAAKRFSLHSRFQARKSFCGIEADLQQKARKGKWTDLPAITRFDDLERRLREHRPPEEVWIEYLPFFRARIPVITGLINLETIVAEHNLVFAGLPLPMVGAAGAPLRAVGLVY